MLVLSRKKRESIMVGDDVEVVLIEIRGDKVRLGIKAPSGVSVHRREVYEAIKRSERREQQQTEGDPDLDSTLSRVLAGDEGIE